MNPLDKIRKKIFRLLYNNTPVKIVDNTRKFSYTQYGNESIKIDEESE